MVQPSLYHGRTKRAISSTKSTTGEHHSMVTIEVDIDGEKFALDLRLHKELLRRKYALSYQKNGKTILDNSSPKQQDICQYHGEIRDRPGSWVAVSTCRGVHGVFFDGKELRYIQPEGTTIDSRHFIYDHSKLRSSFGTESLRNAIKSENYVYDKNRSSKTKMDNNYTTRVPYKGDLHSAYIELVMVVDNRQYRKRHGNLRLIQQEMKDLVNVVNSIFAPLNIAVALVGLKVWSEMDEIHLSTSSLTTLDAFLKYRFQKLLSESPNDHALLLTNQPFSDNVVGKAYVGQMCTHSRSGSVLNLHSEVLGMVAVSIAHEIGHNLGMAHDTKSCECKGDYCIMSDNLRSYVPVLWSNCSLKSLAYSLHKGVDHCLRNIPERLLESPTCGNGFVEIGEQYDCGAGAGGHRAACEACCHPETCVLRSNASCATGHCCNLQTCQLKPVATVCRAANSECDLPEYCTGKSEFCPDDVHKVDTTPCGNNEAYCVRGKCRTHSSQCRLLWGPSAESGHRFCYESNYKQSSATGNCGYDQFKETYIPCKKEDMLCGRLQCKQFSHELEFGANANTGIQLIIFKDKIDSCSTAVIDLGVDEDPGMVPDGARCGEDKICMNHQCLDVTSVRRRIANGNSICPSNCSQHGTCNSKGNCHCDAGFEPPTCERPGAGGSFDSGPASDPDALKNFMIAMYAIFLGILPATVLLLWLVCVLKKNRKPNFSYILDYFKLQNCTRSNFRIFGQLSKSYETENERKTCDNNRKPKIRKNDIKVISDCINTANLRHEKSLKVEQMREVVKNAKDSCIIAPVCVDITSADSTDVKIVEHKNKKTRQSSSIQTNSLVNTKKTSSPC
ncbi:unnamed protein product, partial [Iphiclides podalirius]